MPFRIFILTNFGKYKKKSVLHLSKRAAPPQPHVIPESPGLTFRRTGEDISLLNSRSLGVLIASHFTDEGHYFKAESKKIIFPGVIQQSNHKSLCKTWMLKKQSREAETTSWERIFQQACWCSGGCGGASGIFLSTVMPRHWTGADVFSLELCMCEKSLQPRPTLQPYGL